MNQWLRPSLTSLAKSNRHCDCKFIVRDDLGSKTFSCHKLIFSCASEVFENMLYGNYEEGTTGEVILGDIDRDTFEKFREYIYSYNEETLESYTTPTLIKLAQFGNKYLVPSISTDCTKTLKARCSQLDIGEILPIYECAHNINDKSFISMVTTVIQYKRHKSLTHPNVYALSPNVFLEYVRLTNNLLTEPIRFNMIEMFLKMQGICDSKSNVRISVQIIETSEVSIDDAETLSDTDIGQQLAKDNCKEPALACEKAFLCSNNNMELWEEYVQKLVCLIDFVKFPPKEFYEGPGKSSLLSLEQKYELMYQISKEHRNKVEDNESRCYFCNTCRKSVDLQSVNLANAKPFLKSVRRVDFSDWDGP